MRTENSVKNSIASINNKVVQILLGFLMQTIFVRILGAEYLGLNGLFNNVIIMLSVVDMGIGSAIIFNLYKPIAENDKKQIQILMNFYKRSYRIISWIVLVIGLMLIPILPQLARGVHIKVNINLVYIMYLFDVFSSYWLVYKRSILFAAQKNYLISNVQTVCLIFLDIFQIVILVFTKNFYIYLLIKIIFRIIENFSLSCIAEKEYPFLKEKCNESLPEITKQDITKKVKGLIIHKISKALVNGSDNLVISSFLGVKAVGYYYNYNMIIVYVQQLFLPIIESTTASIGNLLVSNDVDKDYQVFKKIWFINFWIAVFTASSILNLIQPFISLWVGKNFLLPISVVIVLTINHYQQCMMYTFNGFKDAGGIFFEDRYVALGEVVLNIVISILLAKKMGLVGVFAGTIISSCVRHLYSYPYYIFEPLFHRKKRIYYKEFIFKLIVFVGITSISFLIVQKVTISNIILEFLMRIIFSILIPNFLLWLMYRKTMEFQYFLQLVISLILKIRNKIK